MNAGCVSRSFPHCMNTNYIVSWTRTKPKSINWDSTPFPQSHLLIPLASPRCHSLFQIPLCLIPRVLWPTVTAVIIGHYYLPAVLCPTLPQAKSPRSHQQVATAQLDPETKIQMQNAQKWISKCVICASVTLWCDRGLFHMDYSKDVMLRIVQDNLGISSW